MRKPGGVRLRGGPSPRTLAQGPGLDNPGPTSRGHRPCPVALWFWAWFVGSVPGILGFVCHNFRLKIGSKSKISDRILNIFRGPFRSTKVRARMGLSPRTLAPGPGLENPGVHCTWASPLPNCFLVLGLVCGHRAGYFGFGLAQLLAQLRPEIEDSRTDPSKCSARI